jgi:hypothetical protein
MCSLESNVSDNLLEARARMIHVWTSYGCMEPRTNKGALLDESIVARLRCITTHEYFHSRVKLQMHAVMLDHGSGSQKKRISVRLPGSLKAVCYYIPQPQICVPSQNSWKRSPALLNLRCGIKV